MGEKSETGNESFYEQLPAIRFVDALDPARLHLLPGNWTFFVADVINSTEYIEQGNYRGVNLAGAACLTAVFNAVNRLEIPYVFCGDGVQVAVPSSLHRKAYRALHGVGRRMKRIQNLDLRVAGFDVGELRGHGYEIRVGRLAISEHVNQAVFGGNALTPIDQWIRDGQWALERPKDLAEPDLTGLECRWKEIPTLKDEVINLLVQVHPEHPDPSSVYRRIHEEIEATLGTKEQRCPLQREVLNITFSPKDLRKEVDYRYYLEPGWKRKMRSYWNAFETGVGGQFMKKRMNVLGTDWGRYLDDVIRHSDHEKFNGLLCLTASATKEARQRLETHLEATFRNRELAYGISSSHSTLITCVVLERNQRHFHLVDGASGGYALASKDLKMRQQSLGFGVLAMAAENSTSRK